MIVKPLVFRIVNWSLVLLGVIALVSLPDEFSLLKIGLIGFVTSVVFLFLFPVLSIYSQILMKKVVLDELKSNIFSKSGVNVLFLNLYNEVLLFSFVWVMFLGLGLNSDNSGQSALLLFGFSLVAQTLVQMARSEIPYVSPSSILGLVSIILYYLFTAYIVSNSENHLLPSLICLLLVSFSKTLIQRRLMISYGNS
jgi:hypothetical protein